MTLRVATAQEGPSSAVHEWSQFVPLFETILWVAVIVFAILLFRKGLQDLLTAAKKRVEEGASFEAGPVKIGPRPELQKLPYAEPGEGPPVAPASADRATVHGALDRKRQEIYQQNRSVFLVHEIAPSAVANQRYDIFIYLAGHHVEGRAALEEVQSAEFFLGRHFGNKVITGKKIDGVLGMRTSAYGEFLCVCSVTFADGTRVILDRYIDFAMGDRADAVGQNAALGRTSRRR